jgi:hypothetical protein
MSWIDDDAAELKWLKESAAQLEERNREIANAAEKIYNDLWDELVRCIDEAKKTGIPVAAHLMTNGDPFERRIVGHAIIVPQPVKPPASSSTRKVITVKLTADHLQIEVSGLHKTPIYFPLDLCDDGVVRLKHKGEHKTIQDAAKLILRPILFPELYPPE